MDWEQRKAKEVSRKFLLDRIKSDSKIRYMGLPGSKLCFEKKLIELNMVSHMRLFELDQVAYESCFQILSSECHNLSYTFKQEDVDEYILQNPLIAYGIDVCWLDYCGPITPKRIDVVNTLLENSHQDFKLCLTYMVGREKTVVSEGLKNDLSPIPFLKRIHYLMRYLKFPVSIECLYYKDTLPMILLVLKKAEKTTLLLNPFVNGELL